jgi:hypothetical protein
MYSIEELFVKNFALGFIKCSSLIVIVCLVHFVYRYYHGCAYLDLRYLIGFRAREYEKV